MEVPTNDDLLKPEMVSEASSATDNIPTSDANAKQSASHLPSRNLFIYASVVLYSVLAAFAWIVTCIGAFRPDAVVAVLPTGHAAVTGKYQEISHQLERQADLLRIARVLQVIVSLLAVPLTSAACSYAAVSFLQRSSWRTRMSMRQTMALADEGWASPRLLRHLFQEPNGFKRIGSLALLVAFCLNTLGVVIPLLQEILLGQDITRIPSNQLTIWGLSDLVWLFGRNAIKPSNANGVFTLQHQLEEVSPYSLQPLLWTPQTHRECQTHPKKFWVVDVTGSICGMAASLGYIRYAYSPIGQREWIGDYQPDDSEMRNVFLAQLPDNFGTGILQQFAPRLNSSAQGEQIAASKFPQHCDQIEGAFFAEFASPDGEYNVTVCMPDDQRITPWKPTRARYDFQETIFFQVNERYTKVTMNTTSGYFELPNYMNGQTPSSVLNQDPNELCGPACPFQGGEMEFPHAHVPPCIMNNFTRNSYIGHEHYPNEVNPIVPYPPLANITSLELVQNKGPLLTTALALFGRESWIAARHRNPSAYSAQTTKGDDFCVGYAPLGTFTDQNCLTSSQDASEQISHFLRNLNYAPFGNHEKKYDDVPTILAVTLNQAAFLANQILLTSRNGRFASIFSIDYDKGRELQVTTLSSTAMVSISVLLGLQLVSLHALTLYACFRRLWTKSLDAFAMMRLGAAMGPEKIPLAVTQDVWGIQALDAYPGWVGDAAELDEKDEGETRQLALGSTTKIRPKSNYVSYKHDWEGDGSLGLWRRVTSFNRMKS